MMKFFLVILFFVFFIVSFYVNDFDEYFFDVEVDGEIFD